MPLFMAGLFDPNSPERKQAMQMERNAYLEGRPFNQSQYLNAQQKMRDADAFGSRPSGSAVPGQTTMRGAFLAAPMVLADTTGNSGINVNDSGGNGVGTRRRRNGFPGSDSLDVGGPTINANRDPMVTNGHYDLDGNLISGNSAATGRPWQSNGAPTPQPSRLPPTMKPPMPPSDADVLAQSRARVAQSQTRLMRGPDGMPTGQTVAGAVDQVRRRRPGAFAAY